MAKNTVSTASQDTEPAIIENTILKTGRVHDELTQLFSSLEVSRKQWKSSRLRLRIEVRYPRNSVLRTLDFGEFPAPFAAAVFCEVIPQPGEKGFAYPEPFFSITDSKRFKLVHTRFKLAAFGKFLAQRKAPGLAAMINP